MSKSAQDAAGIAVYLQGVWAGLLRLPEVKTEEDFFLLGGDSVLVIEMLLTVSGHFGREFKYDNFFNKPTIHTLSELILAELKNNP